MPDSSDSSDSSAARSIRSRLANRWVLAPFALMGLSVTMASITVVTALNARGMTAEPGYDVKAADWDAHRAQLVRNEKLRWSVTAALDADPADHTTARLRLDLRDKHGWPLDAATVEVEAFPVARADKRATFTLEPLGDGGYRAPLPFRHPGRWEFRVRVERGDDVYTDIFERTLQWHRPGADA